jgi:hypothetical protein
MYWLLGSSTNQKCRIRSAANINWLFLPPPGVAIEGVVEAHFGPQFERVSDPVRIAEGEFGVSALEAGALTARVIKITATPREDVT